MSPLIFLALCLASVSAMQPQSAPRYTPGRGGQVEGPHHFTPSQQQFQGIPVEEYSGEGQLIEDSDDDDGLILVEGQEGTRGGSSSPHLFNGHDFRDGFPKGFGKTGDFAGAFNSPMGDENPNSQGFFNIPAFPKMTDFQAFDRYDASDFNGRVPAGAHGESEGTGSASAEGDDELVNHAAAFRPVGGQGAQRPSFGGTGGIQVVSGPEAFQSGRRNRRPGGRRPFFSQPETSGFAHSGENGQ